MNRAERRRRERASRLAKKRGRDPLDVTIRAKRNAIALVRLVMKAKGVNQRDAARFVLDDLEQHERND